MSRNLCEIDCHFCDHELVLVEEPRIITKQDAGVYFEEYIGMLVANAECPLCLSKYLAWIDDSNCSGHKRGPADYGKWFDTSFRSSFNDEPDEEDLPQYDVQKVYLRVAKLNRKIRGIIV